MSATRVLVTAASKHGATAEIASAIGATLGDHGVDAEVRPPDEVTDLDGYGAVVLGSGVYAGHWLPQAKALVDRLRGPLSQRPVWLFSSGPVGDPLRPEEDPVDVEAVVEATGATQHRVFGGKIDRSRLGFAERAIVMALRAPEGDFRQWDEIARWAETIAAALQPAGQPHRSDGVR